MLKEINRKEFEEKYPEVNIYGLEDYMPVYLENGVVLLNPEWNGEVYTINENGKEKTYRPVYKTDEVDEDNEIIGYEEL